MTSKVDFIREMCTDKFEGIPCNYPDCTCSPENRKEMEADEEASWSEEPDGNCAAHDWVNVEEGRAYCTKCGAGWKRK